MFVDAIQKARKFTRPVVISYRKVDGHCGAGIGTFVILNPDGWILTAAHIVNELSVLDKARTRYVEWQNQLEALAADDERTPEQKRKALKKLRVPPSDVTITHYSAWWSQGGSVALTDVRVLEPADIATGRLVGFDLSKVEYPVFIDPAGARKPGRSLCRLGFPLHEITPSFDKDTEQFRLPEGSVPLPLFPIEGILTRRVLVGKHESGFNVSFLETSSPGLKGQSGGPIIDCEGVVWGIQSRTTSYALGFDPKVPGEGGKRREHQFLNAGWATHPETIHGFLETLGIDHAVTQGVGAEEDNDSQE